MPESFRLIYRITRCVVLVRIVACCFTAESRGTPLPPRFFSCAVLEVGLWLVLDLVLAVVGIVVKWTCTRGYIA
jgi:hypothetical protein